MVFRMVHLSGQIYIQLLCKLEILLFLILPLHSFAQGVEILSPEFEKISSAYRLIGIPELECAYLIAPNGRYVQTWSKPEGFSWKDISMDEEGNLHVSRKSAPNICLNSKGQLISPKKSRIREHDNLKNGNHLKGRKTVISEIDRKGKTVWQYTIPFQKEIAQDLHLLAVKTYDESWVSSLDFFKNLEPPIRKKEIKEWDKKDNHSQQYKKITREILVSAEMGHLDKAYRYMESYFVNYPDDLEGLFVMVVLQSQYRNITLAMKYAKESIHRGLPVERYLIDIGGLLEPLQNSEIFQSFINEKDLPAILHGPMLGKLTDRGVSIWLRGIGRQEVYARVFQEGKEITRSPVKGTQKENEYTVELVIEGLQANSSYQYAVYSGEKRLCALTTFRTFNKANKAIQFDIGFGGGAGYTPWYERMWDTISTHHLPAFLLMGDNVYIDHPERPLTQRYTYYRRQSRPEFRRFASQTSLFAIWDDHDFTYNDSRGGPEKDTPYWKRDVWEVFQNQWINPYYGGGENDPGTYFDVSIGDVDFFLLDTRYYRDDPTSSHENSMLGSLQHEWLLEKLKASRATFKVIGSSVPWAPGTKPGSLDTWDGHPEEREAIFQFIEEEKIEGVLLISADRHRSDAWRIQRENMYPLYDFMSSRLTNVHTHKVMPNSLFGYNRSPSFGVLSIDTTLEDPKLTYKIFSIENEEIHRITVYKSEIDFDFRPLGR